MRLTKKTPIPLQHARHASQIAAFVIFVALSAYSVTSFLAFVAVAVVAGAVFCGWGCPLGTAQEAVGALGRRLLGRRYNRFIPVHLRRRLRYSRYLVAAALLLFPAVGFVAWWGENAVPDAVVRGVWTGVPFSTAAIAVTLAVLGASLLVERPWCTFFCPTGAAFGLANLVRLRTVRRNVDLCISCGKCERACPVQVPITSGEIVGDPFCIGCLRCVADDVCPVSGALEVGNAYRIFDRKT
jgi:polyferredoxin